MIGWSLKSGKAVAAVVCQHGYDNIPIVAKPLIKLSSNYSPLLYWLVAIVFALSLYNIFDCNLFDQSTVSLRRSDWMYGAWRKDCSKNVVFPGTLFFPQESIGLIIKWAWVQFSAHLFLPCGRFNRSSYKYAPSLPPLENFSTSFYMNKLYLHLRAASCVFATLEHISLIYGYNSSCWICSWNS